MFAPFPTKNVDLLDVEEGLIRPKVSYRAVISYVPILMECATLMDSVVLDVTSGVEA